ncbi:MAG: HIT domain-containing protein [Chitinophagia bacterium]|nr:HIT domain-containing protein [Chitinophagia bacterium]
MPSVFSRIIAGELPCYKLAEDDLFIAFLDIQPLAEGHTLVVPKIEVDKMIDLPEKYLSGILPFARPVAHALERAFPDKRCGMSVIGLEVPHAHLHLVPLSTAGDISFTRPKLSFTPQQMLSMQALILQLL